MSARVEDAVSLLAEERKVHRAAARHLDGLVAAIQDRLGEAANRDPEALALNAQCDVAVARCHAIDRALDVLGEHFEV